jgi:FkbM family methyltransferase
MEAVAGEGDTVLDIGANFGALGLLAATRVGPKGNVHLFEPLPLLAKCLTASVMFGGFNQVLVHDCALSNFSGLTEVAIVEPGNLGMTTIVGQDQRLPGERMRVRAENAAEYVPALAGPPAKIIKIDIEGHEGVVLDALSPWMRKVQPGFVLFECHIGSNGFWREQSVDVLARLGYEFFAYDMSKYWKTQLYRVLTHHQNPKGYDFVAVHPNAFETVAGLRFESMISNGTPLGRLNRALIRK